MQPFKWKRTKRKGSFHPIRPKIALTKKKERTNRKTDTKKGGEEKKIWLLFIISFYKTCLKQRF